MLRNCENPLGYFWFQRKPSKTQRNPERPRLRIRLRIRLDDFVIITRGRALYSRRRRIQLMKNRVVGATKQVVNGTAQMLRDCNDGLHPGEIATRLHRRQRVLVQLAGYEDVFDEESLIVSGLFNTFSNLRRSEQWKHLQSVQKIESKELLIFALKSKELRIIIYLTNDSNTC